MGEDESIKVGDVVRKRIAIHSADGALREDWLPGVVVATYPNHNSFAVRFIRVCGVIEQNERVRIVRDDEISKAPPGEYEPDMPIGVEFVSVETWEERGRILFGADRMKWRFKCPVCGYVATAIDWIDAGASENAIAFSCVGRWQSGVGCDYAGGGLFRLNPIHVVVGELGKAYVRETFAFADE